MESNQRLIIVTRQDLSPGYQIAQSCHAVAEFAYADVHSFMEWRKNGNYMINLAVKDRDALSKLIIDCYRSNIKVAQFYEPDIDQVTSVALFPSLDADMLTRELPLAGKSTGSIDKHTTLHGSPSVTTNI